MSLWHLWSALGELVSVQMDTGVWNQKPSLGWSADLVVICIEGVSRGGSPEGIRESGSEFRTRALKRKG